MHLSLHIIVPMFVAVFFFRKRWLKAFIIMLATMLVDVDHSLADPIYDPQRCSIGFHPLHHLGFICLYLVLCFVPKARLVGIGLVLHMALDSIDCQVTNGVWMSSWAPLAPVLGVFKEPGVRGKILNKAKLQLQGRSVERLYTVESAVASGDLNQ